MILAAMHTTRRLLRCALLATGLLMLPGPVDAATVIKPIPTQYIAALGDPGATSGTGAESWGLWPEDPGPSESLSRFFGRFPRSIVIYFLALQ